MRIRSKTRVLRLFKIHLRRGKREGRRERERGREGESLPDEAYFTLVRPFFSYVISSRPQMLRKTPNERGGEGERWE